MKIASIEYEKSPCVKCSGRIRKVGLRVLTICYLCTQKKFQRTWKASKAERIKKGIPLRITRTGHIAEPNAYIARSMVNMAIKRGLLPRQDTLLCVDCGAQAQEYDHRDYNRPLDVQPVCHGCNCRRGSAIPFALPGFATNRPDPATSTTRKIEAYAAVRLKRKPRK